MCFAGVGRLLFWEAGLQSSARERETSQWWCDAHSILHDRLCMQLCLLCVPRVPLANADVTVLDMLDISEVSGGPTGRFRAFWAWSCRSWDRLVHNLVLPGKPASEPLVCNSQCCCRICSCHVRFDSIMLLAQHLQRENVSDIFRPAFHNNWSRIQHHSHH